MSPPEKRCGPDDADIAEAEHHTGNRNRTSDTSASAFAGLLRDTLGYTDDEHVSIGHDADGAFRTAVLAAADAPAFVAKAARYGEHLLRRQPDARAGTVERRPRQG